MDLGTSCSSAGLLSGFLFICFISLSPSSFAGCDWSSASAGVSSSVASRQIVLEAPSYRMLFNRSWREDSRFPAGSLLALETLTLSARMCSDLYELSGKLLDVIYYPPSNSSSRGLGFMVPSSADGVSMFVEFPSGSVRAGAVVLATSSETVRPGGQLLLNRTGIPPVPMRLSLVKTGAFSGDTANAVIHFPEGVGFIKYFAAGQVDTSAADNQLVVSGLLNPAVANDASRLANAKSPACQAHDSSGTGMNALSTIRLASLPTTSFVGPGATELALHRQPLLFSCEAALSSVVSVSFNAAFPLNNGVDGVGMPSAASDVGVQILLNDSPVVFEQNSPALPWSPVSYDAQGRGYVDPASGTVSSSHGHYCRADCGDHMAGSNWFDGGPASGSNRGVGGALLTFRYYQTTADTPAAQQFSVPFTISLDVH